MVIFDNCSKVPNGFRKAEDLELEEKEKEKEKEIGKR